MKNKHCDFITCRSWPFATRCPSRPRKYEWRKNKSLEKSLQPLPTMIPRTMVLTANQCNILGFPSSVAPAEAQRILPWLPVSRKENTFEVKRESIIQIETEEVQLRSLWMFNEKPMICPIWWVMMSITLIEIPPLNQWIWSQTIWRTYHSTKTNPVSDRLGVPDGLMMSLRWEVEGTPEGTRRRN